MQTPNTGVKGAICRTKANDMPESSGRPVHQGNDQWMLEASCFRNPVSDLIVSASAGCFPQLSCA